MIRLPGGRKRSERLMKKNSFSNYMNTGDNPLDEDGNEIEPNSKGSTSNNPPVVKKLIEVNNQGSTEGNNAIGVKVELRHQPPLTVASDVKLLDDETIEGDRKKLLPSVKLSDESGLKERIDGTRGRLRNSDTKAKDQMKRANESVLDAGIEDGVRIPKREVNLPVIRTRTFPRALYDAIRKLNDDQQKAVISMGLGNSR